MVSAGTGEWNSTNRAEWRGKQRQFFMAIFADMKFSRIRDERAADVTDWGEDYIKQRIKKLLDASHLKPQISVYNQQVEIGESRFSVDNGCDSTETIR